MTSYRLCSLVIIKLQEGTPKNPELPSEGRTPCSTGFTG